MSAVAKRTAGLSAPLKHGHRLRRFLDHKSYGEPLSLHPHHPSAVEGRTKYRERVVWPGFETPVLKSGMHNRKIGKRVVKGKWAGMPIFTLTLEERATCPRSCLHWLDCYGNKMNWSVRLIAGQTLEAQIEREIEELQVEHPEGFVIRLHVLGDFYDVPYVLKWMIWLLRYPALHVFGYTARPQQGEIGDAIAWVISTFWERFAIRFSNQGIPMRGTTTIYREPEASVVDEGIVCPAQTGKTECCGTCGLCWSTDKNIVFVAH